MNALASLAQKKEICLVAVVFGFKLLNLKSPILRLLGGVSNHHPGMSNKFFGERVWIAQNYRRLSGSCPAMPDKKIFLGR